MLIFCLSVFCAAILILTDDSSVFASGKWNREGSGYHRSFSAKIRSAGSGATQATNSITKTFSFKPPTLTLNGIHYSIEMPRTDIWHGSAGSPRIPFKAARFLIPSGLQVVSVKITPGEMQDISGSFNIEPVEQAVPIDQSPQAPQAPEDSLIYNSDNPYPSTPCGDAFVQSKRGCTLLLINLYPVEYLPLSGKISYYASITVEIEVAPQEAAAPLGNNDTASATSADKSGIQAISQTIDNPEALSSYQQANQNTAAQYEYVIITTNNLAGAPHPNLTDLIEAKKAKGLSAKLFTVENDIYPVYSGTRPDGKADNQTKIRNFIIDCYIHHGTQYVLLSGDKDNIPPRMFHVRSSYQHSPYYEADLPADLYYACLDGTFDEIKTASMANLATGPAAARWTCRPRYMWAAHVRLPNHRSTIS